MRKIKWRDASNESLLPIFPGPSCSWHFSCSWGSMWHFEQMDSRNIRKYLGAASTWRRHRAYRDGEGSECPSRCAALIRYSVFIFHHHFISVLFVLLIIAILYPLYLILQRTYITLAVHQVFGFLLSRDFWRIIFAHDEGFWYLLISVGDFLIYIYLWVQGYLMSINGWYKNHILHLLY